MDAGSISVSFKAFRELRVSRLSCELNALADFKKYQDRRLPAFVSRESVYCALVSDGVSAEDAEGFTQKLFLFDHNLDGVLSYKELYDFIMKRIPEEWLEWLTEK